LISEILCAKIRQLEGSMIALFKKRVFGSRSSYGTRSTRLRQNTTTPVSPDVNVHFEAGWTDCWSHRRCYHEHQTLIEAARCVMPTGAGWYVIAVENGTPRQLRTAEEAIVDRFRFGPKDSTEN
jgi:hypothetical protein